MRTVLRAASAIPARHCVRPVAATALSRQSALRFKTSSSKDEGTSSGHPIAILNHDILPLLPTHSEILFTHKKRLNLSFESIGKALGRDEVAVAAIFYGQAQASNEDIEKLAKLLEIPLSTLRETEITGYPDRGGAVPLPPKDPLIYRLFEIVQNYGYPYKAVINEKFGDGIMSAISFSTKVEKETDAKGEWCKITLRGKWLPYTRF